MAIQYSGNAQTSTFTPVTKQDIINNVGAALLAAGWTTASGGTGTTNWMLTSATTPQGFAINVRMKDNGGNCVTFSLESTDGVLVGGNSTTVGGAFLNPVSGSVYRVVCNKYQAFIYVTPDSGASRTFAAFGVPFTPSWITSITSRVGWIMGNAATDADTTSRFSFREQLSVTTNNPLGAEQAIYNSNIWSQNSVSSITGTGALALANFLYPGFSSNTTGYRWENGSALIVDALIGWNETGPVTSEGKFKGQLWDAAVSTDAYPGDDTATFDGHNWICITDGNAVLAQRGTLLIATS